MKIALCFIKNKQLYVYGEQWGILDRDTSYDFDVEDTIEYKELDNNLDHEWSVYNCSMYRDEEFDLENIEDQINMF